MLKKEEWIVLGAFLLFVSLFAYFNHEGLAGITGMATSNASSPSFDVVLTKDSIAVGDKVEGYLNLNFTGPVDPSTVIDAELDGLSSQLSLKDYFNKKNISFTETESSTFISNSASSKTFSFESGGSKNFAFKLPKTANVGSFYMDVTGRDGPSFIILDVEDYADKPEWQYFGSFVKFKSDYVYPSSLDIDKEGDSVTIGGAVGSVGKHNETYFCEAIDLPESKDFELSAKFKKEAEGADMKVVLLTFDGEYASGGANNCDLPEPGVGAAAGWQSCELPFTTSKQGIYLVCVYYEGDNEQQYYKLSRDSTPSDSRYTCKITGGSTLCYPETSKDYFIRSKIAEYTGFLDGTALWIEGVTDQDMNFSLTQFLIECEEDDINDCIVPVTISSDTAGDVELNNLDIDYIAGSDVSESNTFYDFAQIPGVIDKIGGVDLNNGSKMIEISLSEFNLTAPNVTEVIETFHLRINVIPGGKVTKPVKVYGEGYVPETTAIEDKLADAKKVISDMKTDYGDELDLFGIELDTSTLTSYEEDVDKIKSDTNLSLEEIDAQLNTLSGQIDSYLQNKPRSFGAGNSFKDLYIPEPNDVEQVVPGGEGIREVYSAQNKIEISVDVTNYILKKYDESEKKYSVITKTIIPKKTLSNVYIYEIISKTLANNVKDIFFKNKDYEIIEPDPIIRYEFSSLSKSTTIVYGVKDQTITPTMASVIGSIIVPKEIEEVIEPTHECGDGICTEIYEDKDICPEDCGGRVKLPWTLIIVLVVLLIAGVVYINFYKGKGAFRRLMGRSPFSTPKALAGVKNYIKAAQNKGVKNQSIANALLKSGWTKGQVVYAFEDLKWDEKRLFTIKFAPGGKANVRKLKTFIKKCLQLNIPPQKIRNILVQKGWDVNKVNEIFSEVGKPEEKVETVKDKQKKVAFYFEKALEEEAKK